MVKKKKGKSTDQSKSSWSHQYDKLITTLPFKTRSATANCERDKICRIILHITSRLLRRHQAPTTLGAADGKPCLSRPTRRRVHSTSSSRGRPTLSGTRHGKGERSITWPASSTTAAPARASPRTI